MGQIHRFFFILLCKFVRLILRVRYKIEVRGLQDILRLQRCKPGVLFLPNHPAEVDPIILTAILGPHFFVRSVVVEHFYHLKGFKKILDFGRVVPSPTMDDKANKWRKKELDAMFELIRNGLDQGENFMIYPAGQLKETGVEQLGGASLAHSILLGREDIPVILVRTTGLWGSRFSKAWTGKSPNFGKTLAYAFKAIIKNLIFFVPKRRVIIEFQANPVLPYKEGRLEFNRALELWYNQYPSGREESISFIPYSIWNKEEEPIRVSQEKVEEEKHIEVPQHIQEDVLLMLSALCKRPKEKITNESSLAFDLGLDSLDIAEVHAFLDKKYDAAWIPLGDLKKVRDVFRAIVEKRDHRPKQGSLEEGDFSSWFEKKKREAVFIPEGETIAEVFLRNCKRMGRSVACADALSGVLSYRKLKLASILLAEEYKNLPGSHVGVLLPSSVGAYLTILALLLAGKVPVMLNWTAGKKSLNHAISVGEFSITLTSRRFLDKIQLEDLGEVEGTFLFLEKVKEKISWKKKGKGVFLSLLPAKVLLQRWPVEKDKNKPAVLLFTSGSESMPKAVPLSHANLLMNQRGVTTLVPLYERESLYGVLPPFHSFGFSLTGLFPLLSGLKVFYAPDPTDAHTMALDIQRMHLSLVCLAPSFLAALFSSARLEQLESLTLLVSGAEKPQSWLPAFVKEKLPRARWLEGYGITECSPVVTLYSREEGGKGVGKPLPGVKLMVVDPGSLEEVAPGAEGEVCIVGPSVFQGYLKEEKDPFFYKEGKKWYRSGDLGRIDNEGYLYIIERLKRTIKIGGEMISLSAVEEELLRVAKEKMWYHPSKEGPPLAILATKSEKPDLVLFSIFSVPLEEINFALRESGLARVVKVAQLVELPEIPLSGTGKLNYRMLEEKLVSGVYV